MARRWLIGAAVGLLLADGVLFAGLAGPFAASRRVEAARPVQVARSAIVLPTYDPDKPRPTHTPTPLPTPWFVPTVTPTATATFLPTPTDTPSPEQPAFTAASPAPVVVAQAGTPPGNVNPAATAPSEAVAPADTLQPAAQFATAPASAGAPAVAGAAQPSPTAAADAPTMEPDATATTASSDPATATPQPSAFTPGDEEQFTSYLRDHYGTLAGQPLQIAAIELGQTQDGLPDVRIEAGVDASNNAFTGHTAEAEAYGRSLLSDAEVFYSGQSVAIEVIASLQSESLDECSSNPGWCHVDAFDSDNNAWTVSWTYVKGRFDGGAADISTWNPDQ